MGWFILRAASRRPVTLAEPGGGRLTGVPAAVPVSVPQWSIAAAMAVMFAALAV